jgi:subtilisin family serine protease
LWQSHLADQFVSSESSARRTGSNSREVTVARIDPYLFHRFETLKELKTAEVYTAGPQKPDLIPMLVRVANPADIPSLADTKDCRVTSGMGNIVACLGSLATIEIFEKDARVLSVEASRPSSGYDCSHSVPFVKAERVQKDPLHPEKGDHALVAVIDEGIDVLHEAFRDAHNQTRIVALWDQTDPTGPGPTVQGRSLHGTFHSEKDINRYISAGKVPKNLGRDPHHHGTHVASIAAGQKTAKFYGGVAPEAKILVVVPRIKVDLRDPFSIGYSTSHVDALSFIESEANQRKLPVVVNVSLGMNAGAHDGTSNLEAAFDSFSSGARAPGRVIVKSAGNERATHGHAKFAVPPLSGETLTWTSREPHPGPDVIELWFPACDDHKIRLVDPSREASLWVEANQSKHGIFGSGNGFQISYDKFHWDNGDSRVLVTVSMGQNSSIGTGDWSLEIHAKSVKSDGTMHAWIERDDTRPIKFVNHQQEEYTLSIPGTARTVIAVASVAASLPLLVAAYSSYGPTRDARYKPDLAAPGESIWAAKAGTFDDIEFMSGTSMATPHVSGAIALLFSRREKLLKTKPGSGLKQFNAAQIRAALTQTVQNFNGRPSHSMGYGVLDVEAFLRALL